MRKSLAKVSLFVLAFTFFAFTSHAGSGDPQGPKAPNPKSNGAFTAHFVYSYNDWLLGSVNGHGERVQNKNVTKDNFSFTIDLSQSLIGPGTYTQADFGWFSDYDHLYATSFTMTITDNGDGTATVTGQAIY